MIALAPLLALALAGSQALGTWHSALDPALGIRHSALDKARLDTSMDSSKQDLTSAQRPVPSAGQAVAAPEVIAEIRVHGNLIVSNDDVIKIAGVTAGQPFVEGTIAEVTERLRASKKFDDIEVLKRFASIADPSQIALVIVVNEGPVRIRAASTPGAQPSVVRRRGLRRLMVAPILDAEDGYGLTYGAQLALIGVTGPRSRISVPMTWGGLKHTGVEFDRRFLRGPVTRIETGVALQRQTNPAFHLDDDRQWLWARAERGAGPFRAGGTIGWQHVSFGELTGRFRSVSGDLAFDTRLDPVLPRNAVLAVASLEHLSFDSGGSVNRSRLEGRGYVGLFGPAVLAVRGVHERADGPLPPYLKSILGGWSNLRGFQAGSFVGDSMVTASAELRIPLTSSLKIAKVGVSVFVDAGAAYDHGQQFSDQPMHRGAGAGLWMTATIFHLGVSVAHGRGVGTRVNFGAGISF